MSIHIDFILIRRAIATLVRRCLDQSRSLVITLSILFPSAALADNVYVTSDDCSAPPTTCALYIVGSSGTVTGSITVGDDPIGVALSPDGTYGSQTKATIQSRDFPCRAGPFLGRHRFQVDRHRSTLPSPQMALSYGCRIITTRYPS
jgi:hypothetical protein